MTTKAIESTLDVGIDDLIAALRRVQAQEQTLANQQADLQEQRHTLETSLVERLLARLGSTLATAIGGALRPLPVPPEQRTTGAGNSVAPGAGAAGAADPPVFTIQFNHDKAQAYPIRWDVQGNLILHGYDLRPTWDGHDPIPLTGIVLHSTEGPRGETWQAALAAIRDAPNVSAHYYISKTGEISRILDPVLFRAWHAGRSFYNRLRDWNNFAVGIELHHRRGEGPYPDAQLVALRWLCRRLMTDHPTIIRENIVLHRWIAVDERDRTGRKSDPTELDDTFWRPWIAAL